VFGRFRPYRGCGFRPTTANTRKTKWTNIAPMLSSGTVFQTRKSRQGLSNDYYRQKTRLEIQCEAHLPFTVVPFLTFQTLIYCVVTENIHTPSWMFFVLFF